MRATRISMAAGTALVLSLLLASVTLASGPGNGSGREQFPVTCEGQLYVLTVNNGNGTGQVVDDLGHAILVNGTGTATVTSTILHPTLDLFSFPLGHGRGHANQTKTQCTSVSSLTVEQLGPPPPGGWGEGVLPGDTVVFTYGVVVVLKV